MNKRNLIENFVACSVCQSVVQLVDEVPNLKCLNCGKKFFFLDNEILMMLDNSTTDNETSQLKWESAYQTWSDMEDEFRSLHMDGMIRQLLQSLNSCELNESKVYLEIGCGMGFIGEELTKSGWTFIGVDYSLTALRALKKRLDERGIDRYLLIYGDIEKMPVSNNSIDFVGGYGVIEHIKDPTPALKHIYRVLKKGGISFNTVPYLNIGNIFYRSIMWGGIPNMPVLKQISEFINIKLLKEKRMTFGYELQLSARQLLKMHCNSGFNADNVSIEQFECDVKLQFIKLQWLKRKCRKLCENYRQFWPMVKVIAKK